MQLTVNGKPEFLSVPQADINTLLSELKVKQVQYVTVELNGKIIDRGAFGTTLVNDGDKVEFLYFMGGGT